MLKGVPKYAVKGPGGVTGKTGAILDPDACKGMGGESHALLPGKRTRYPRMGGWVGPTGKVIYL